MRSLNDESTVRLPPDLPARALAAVSHCWTGPPLPHPPPSPGPRRHSFPVPRRAATPPLRRQLPHTAPRDTEAPRRSSRALLSPSGRAALLALPRAPSRPRGFGWRERQGEVAAREEWLDPRRCRPPRVAVTPLGGRGKAGGGGRGGREGRAAGERREGRRGKRGREGIGGREKKAGGLCRGRGGMRLAEGEGARIDDVGSGMAQFLGAY
ncbi:LOW QUALITY PROTEIN: hypothetical protein GQ55_9G260000 [Panicum hallii var. hallii]|uniref:Uncharacterized protein n=1 Tax=Panicum hallii var. hallii TaxID=1504633 RepID=A0A2T7C700_9POAL|nr:LOW QUALITY PROTEIN: hypothetical protein GQ55_9G260000 [Panicum hallii var. hallii]